MRIAANPQTPQRLSSIRPPGERWDIHGASFDSTAKILDNYTPPAEGVEAVYRLDYGKYHRLDSVTMLRSMGGATIAACVGGLINPAFALPGAAFGALAGAVSTPMTAQTRGRLTEEDGSVMFRIHGQKDAVNVSEFRNLPELKFSDAEVAAMTRKGRLVGGGIGAGLGAIGTTILSYAGVIKPELAPVIGVAATLGMGAIGATAGSGVIIDSKVREATAGQWWQFK
ncbi:MAG: hypothetical protein AB7S38_39045 [Vulcanimicrobiota bacterium]